MVCEECGAEDGTVRMAVSDDDTFPLCKPCRIELGLPTQAEFLR